ncbi:succinylglutamate desuccinylase/aspartoacylase family protein [Acetobacter sacchari]|uniref:Succinylglutamate desuccinylase/aspartoacylase family protein n=1 Tax=Acetobacter sacchari TaxID=2661687 RepID=A0ABS3LSF9_9PROT|nr:succinylglutamate desuccinylase/aspartoacylase family protein [Acetobacter sacchari]MBO1358834.1 succinylglutamate desuccinylase/aspartoacylase family protein [Acetobacter sacchari]
MTSAGREPQPVRAPAPRLSETLPPTPPRLPTFTLEIPPPDLSPWVAGNTGVPGLHQFNSGRPGPHVAVSALMHGNEYAGAIVLAELLREGVTPRRGKLSLVFLNLAAFARFDSERPIASRFVDEDMNRLWRRDTLDQPASSSERDRVRSLIGFFDTVDMLLDLHSMLWPSDPLVLSGPSEAGCALAREIGTPPLIVSDSGHAGGPRLIDYERFVTPATGARACLLEAGQHWAEATLALTRKAVSRFLGACDVLGSVEATGTHPRVAEVTECVTARTTSLTFLRNFRGGEIIPRQGTVIALDGPEEIRTPYDDCMLIMPNHRAARGHTAVRLARVVA